MDPGYGSSRVQVAETLQQVPEGGSVSSGLEKGQVGPAPQRGKETGGLFSIPVCLLNEAGKILKRIIAERLVIWREKIGD